jgi:hypothetical protein
MLRYPRTNATANIGLDFLRGIVRSHNCIFQEIDTANDLGIDAIIEIVKDERPTSKFIAAQIKSGKSYYDKKSNKCKIPIKKHRDYWANHPMPVFGIVYVPEFENAYWVDIKRYMEYYPDDSVISFEPTLARLINKTTFFTQFVPHLLNEIPDVPFGFAKSLFCSYKEDEFYLGLYILFKRYAYLNEVWELFVEFFKQRSIEDIPGKVVYYLAYIPWHGDIFSFRDSFTQESRRYGQALIDKFGKAEILKLLTFIDEENMIQRGTLGQSVEAIISSVPNVDKYLEEIIRDKNVELSLREYAAIIHAFHNGEKSIDLLSEFKDTDSQYISELIEHIKTYKLFNPYA